jgi:hypothetical protein
MDAQALSAGAPVGCGGGARLGVVGLQQLPVAANASKKGNEGYATARDLAGGQGKWAGGQVGSRAAVRRPPSDRGRLQGEREPGRYKAQARERDIELARQPGR